MLVTQLKPEEEILSHISKGKIFVFECLGCEEVYFPREEVEGFIASLKEQVIGKAVLDYLCNREFAREYIRAYSHQIEKAQAILVFSCGVGAQILSSLKEDKPVYIGCDTLYLNGFQGLRVQELNCEQCGECHLNYTGGICPIANCSKNLFNGPCGGSEGGKCEIDPDLPCAWQLIIERLTKLGRLDKLEAVVPPKDWSVSLTGGPPRPR